VREHVLCYIITGELRYAEADTVTIGRPGDIILFRRNLLVKCEKRPSPDGQPFKILYFILEKTFLLQYALRQQLPIKTSNVTCQPVLLLPRQPALISLFHSVFPYLDANTFFSQAMIKHKLEEAILVLLEHHSNMKYWLFDFAEQGKLNLETFMQRNYMFNVPMTKFAELTGRSLSTFQRDFRKTMGTNASTWLLKRRLQAAYEAITTKGSMPVDIYLDLGFEDIAHFSRSFKKEFGVTPTQVRKQPGLVSH
jgi:AraC-like DNA-binding protein